MMSTKFLYDAKRNMVIRVERAYITMEGEFWKNGKVKVVSMYEDEDGCIYAIQETESSVDPINRCGVGFFSVDDKELVDVCKVHDYMYSTPAYQLFHTRAEADNYMYKHMIKRRPIVGRIFYGLTRIFGGLFWEGSK